MGKIFQDIKTIATHIEKIAINLATITQYLENLNNKLNPPVTASTSESIDVSKLNSVEELFALWTNNKEIDTTSLLTLLYNKMKEYQSKVELS